MSDIKDILNSVLNDEKLLNSRAFRDRVYTDQPILKRASQIKTYETPQKIKDMKSLAYTAEARWKTSVWLFYTQGKFMESYTDVYEYSGDFVKYYPTYRDLSTEQLRGYFSWRARLRNGEYQSAPLPFIYMYAYELINGIGVTDPMNGLTALGALYREYGGLDPELGRNLLNWKRDYCVYYELPPGSADDIAELEFDNALLRLIHWEASTDEELFSSLLHLSAYPIQRSRFYIQYNSEYEQVAVRVFRRLSDFYRERRKNSLCENYFGHIVELRCFLFEYAVFYDRNSSRDTEYSLNEINSYTCRRGEWSCRKYYGTRRRNKKLGDLMKMIDGTMREYYGFSYKLKLDKVSNEKRRLIQKEIEAVEAEKRRKKAMNVSIDLSALADIRAAADITRDKLIVDEESAEPAGNTGNTAVPENSAPAGLEQPDASDEAPSLLDKAETAFLSALINGSGWSEEARACGIMPSILADSINEKLFDSFGDTVIDFSGDVPELIEDYIPELEQLIK